MATAPYAQASQDYQRVEKALAFLGDNFQRQPALKDVAQSAGLSEYHFQRLFRRWVGISPKRFLQFLTKEHAKELLKKSNLLDASYEVGLSGPGRLHDLFVNCEAVTPGEFKSQGASLNISYGFHPSPFGEVLLATTERGLCGLFFVVGDNRRRALAALRRHWPEAALREDARATAPLVRRIFSPRSANGRQPRLPRQRRGQRRGKLPLHLKGTNFQIKVWEALLGIPEGAVVSYEDLAARIGKPGASRAVGNAVAQNPISYLIPCHRVIRKLGETGNYGGGPARKKALLGWEAARTAANGHSA